MANKKATEAKRQVKAAYVKELTRLDKQHGGVKASTVVAEAEPKESPLHPWFEWDNKKAGHAHRLMQARTLIRVVVPQLEGAISPAPDPYVHVPAEKAEDGKEGTYHRMSVVVESVDLFSRALAELATKVRMRGQPACASTLAILVQRNV